MAEWLCGELQQPVPRRAAQRGVVRGPARGEDVERDVAERLQPPSAALVAGVRDPGGVRRVAGWPSAAARGCAPRLRYGPASDGTQGPDSHSDWYMNWGQVIWTLAITAVVYNPIVR